MIERKQTDSQKTEIISWIASGCESIKLTLWKLWSVSYSAINESLALTGRNWISTWWETSSIMRNTVSALILFFISPSPPLFPFQGKWKAGGIKSDKITRRGRNPIYRYQGRYALTFNDYTWGFFVITLHFLFLCHAIVNSLRIHIIWLCSQ